VIKRKATETTLSKCKAAHCEVTGDPGRAFILKKIEHRREISVNKVFYSRHLWILILTP